MQIHTFLQLTSSKSPAAHCAQQREKSQEQEQKQERIETSKQTACTQTMAALFVFTGHPVEFRPECVLPAPQAQDPAAHTHTHTEQT